MGTSYSIIFERFLSKITDFRLMSLSDDDVYRFCYDLMTSATPKIAKFENDLSDRDDELSRFNSTLTDIEIECIATQMVSEWIEPQLNNTLLLKQFIGTKDEKFYAQANQIDKLLTLQESARVRGRKLRRDWAYQNSDYLGV